MKPSNYSWCKQRTPVASILVGVFMMCSMSPTFMLRIWNMGDWMKRELAQPIYGWVEPDSPIFGWFIALINEKFIPLIFMWKIVDVYMDFDG